jgi:hypothetical protein
VSGVLLVAALAVVIGVAAALRRPAARRAVPPSLRRTAASVARWRLVGVAAGVAAAAVAVSTGALGRGLLLAGPVFALCVLAGVVTGELVAERPGGAIRSAALETRRVRDYLPRALTACVGTATVLLAVVLAVTVAMGSPDDLGRAGRSLVRRCSAVMTEGAGPWPGSYYAIPVAALVACGLAGAAVALVRVVRRPRAAEDPAADDALRRRSAEAVTAAAGLLAGVPLAGVAAVAGGALLGVACRPAWFDVLAVGLGLVAVAATGLAAWCFVALAAGAGAREALPQRWPAGR